MSMTTLRAMPAMDQMRLSDLLYQHHPAPASPSYMPASLDQLSSQSSQQHVSLYSRPIDSEDEDANPILVRPTPCSYDTLFDTLLSTHFGDSESMVQNNTLPPELVKRVLSFLTIKRVKQEQIQATNSSSHDGVHPLSATLVDNETSWWLASHGTMAGGRGEQWVQYQLAPNSSLRRVSTVSVKIPPMPQGPLSVREFCLQTFSIERGWHAVTPIFTMANKTGWQTFLLPEDIDVDEVRLACLSNQMVDYLTNLRANHPNDTNFLTQLGRFESVGFFAVRFE